MKAISILKFDITVNETIENKTFTDKCYLKKLQWLQARGCEKNIGNLHANIAKYPSNTLSPTTAFISWNQLYLRTLDLENSCRFISSIVLIDAIFTSRSTTHLQSLTLRGKFSQSTFSSVKCRKY